MSKFIINMTQNLLHVSITPQYDQVKIYSLRLASTN